jgi:hypothetical protein
MNSKVQIAIIKLIGQTLTLVMGINKKEDSIMADLTEIKTKSAELLVALATLIADADDIKTRLDAAIAANNPVLMQTISDELSTAIANAQAEHAKLTG